jgi:adenosine deaminase
MPVKGWNGTESIQDIKSVIESLNRFVLFNKIDLKKETEEKIIDFIPFFEGELYKQQENIWENFLNELQNSIDNNDGELFKNTSAILFYTPEEIPRGDFSDSVYNESRMIRNFFENTSYARTANYNNIIEKIKELIVELKKDKKKKLKDAIDLLNQLKEQVSRLRLAQPSLSDLSEIYTYQSFHTRKAHGNLREFKKFLDKNKNNGNCDDMINKFRNDYYLARKKHDIASIISVNPWRFEQIKILVIDDNPGIENDLKEILPFLPDGTEIWITESSEYKKFIHNPEFIRGLYNCNGSLRLKQIVQVKDYTQQELFESVLPNEKSKKFYFDYIIVDLLLGDYNEGNKIIRQLVKLRDYLGYEKASFFILTFSQSEDVDDIYRAFAEGSLGYAWKFNRVFHIPFLIGELETARQKFSQGIGTTISHANARNFEKLYHLPPKVIMRLRTESFLPYKEIENKIDPLFKDVARNWIKKIPKADLHYHLGGSMDDKIIFYLAANTLCYFNPSNTNTLNRLIREFQAISKSIKQKRDFYVEFFKNKNSFYQNLDKVKKILDKGKEINEAKNILIIEWLKQTFGRDDKIKSYIKKNIDKPAELYFDFLAYKYKDKKISKDDIITLFIVYVGLLEGRTIEDAKSFWSILRSKIKEKGIDKLLYRLDKFNPKILNTETNCYLEIFSQISKISSTNYNGLLKSLLLAPENAKSLAEMFRGDCFFGALHLQYYENIVACIWYLADQAVEEKNRYLEIRVSPSGYTSKDLSLKEAVEALKDGANFASLYYFMKGEFVWINFISTLKRHKTSKERIEELVTALIEDEKTSKMLESNINKVILETASPKSTYLPYDWKASRFVGVDLAGYESEFPPVNFIEDFTPAFKLNTLITIHAGEEAGPQFIWEALYKLQADRIGHGLTIYQAQKLMEKVCDKQTCIELCPLSNEITNFRGRSNKYPLFRYLKKGLNVTINTDDKAQTGGNINEDFIKAAEYFYLSEDNEKNIPLTKWETLRLVKAGFDNAFIHREEKRNLLRWVEEEIYEIILKDYEIEPYYIVDK